MRGGQIRRMWTFLYRVFVGQVRVLLAMETRRLRLLRDLWGNSDDLRGLAVPGFEPVTKSYFVFCLRFKLEGGPAEAAGACQGQGRVGLLSKVWSLAQLEIQWLSENLTILRRVCLLHIFTYYLNHRKNQIFSASFVCEIRDFLIENYRFLRFRKVLSVRLCWSGKNAPPPHTLPTVTLWPKMSIWRNILI